MGPMRACKPVGSARFRAHAGQPAVCLMVLMHNATPGSCEMRALTTFIAGRSRRVSLTSGPPAHTHSHSHERLTLGALNTLFWQHRSSYAGFLWP